MFKDPLFLTKVSGGLLAGLWVAVAAVVASWALYQPAAIDTPSYPLIAAEEAEAPVEAAAAETETAVATETPAETTVEAPTESPAETPAASGVGALLASADIEAGAKVGRKCSACHTFDKGGKNKVGPNLWDIVGRAIGGAEGYPFSGALSGMGGEWGYAELDGFLAAPKTFAPGTKMSFSGIKGEADRANLIAYMRTLSDSPKPLP